MNPFFTIQRKSDNKTDFIYEYDFKAGKFIGGTASYTYNDIIQFIGVPGEILKSLFVKETKNAAKLETKGDDE